MRIAVCARARGLKAAVQADLSGKMLVSSDSGTQTLPLLDLNQVPSLCWSYYAGCQVLERLMRQMRLVGKERIVIVSNYTQTLDVISNLCRERNWPVTRLDGSTTVTKRQKLVDAFNDPFSDSFAFLLSSKAGGCGINLIGASRLVLFDPDWNPAVDKQAAARVWREGQKRRCFIYRFVSTGTIEEKIFMRQLSKEGLQSIVDDKEEVNSLSSKDLRKLFMYDESTISDTHNKLSCTRCPLEALSRSSVQAAEGPTGINKAQTAEVLALLQRLSESPLMETIEPGVAELSAALAEGSEDPGYLDLKGVTSKLCENGYASLPAFAKEMRRMLRATERAAGEQPALQLGLQRLSACFESEWRSLAPRLITLRDEEDVQEQPAAAETEEPKPAPQQEGEPMEMGEGQEESKDSAGDAPPAAGVAEEGGAAADGEEGAKAGVQFQPQVGMPLEEDMNNWSHHWSVETVDDPVLRTAMEDLGHVISFIFGLEVTWDLLQRFPAPEVKPKEKRSGVRRLGGKKKREGDDDSSDDNDELDVSETEDPKPSRGRGGRGRGGCTYMWDLVFLG